MIFVAALCIAFVLCRRWKFSWWHTALTLVVTYAMLFVTLLIMSILAESGIT